MSPTDHQKMSAFCARIGLEPLVIQGAGGNASWKDGATLWVKASGTRMAEAEARNIFVPVDLHHLRQKLALGDFSIEPKTMNEGALRPSIETLLHGLMPQKYVLHVHAVDPLALLIRQDANSILVNCLANSLIWIFVDYHKPGADLAKAINDCVDDLNDIDVVFMANHGIVIAAETMEELEKKLLLVLEKTHQTPAVENENDFFSHHIPAKLRSHYRFAETWAVNRLAYTQDLLNLCKSHWVMYPDHAIFLGARPTCLSEDAADEDFHLVDNVILLEGIGVLVRKDANASVVEQLQCYGDVLARVDVTVPLCTLSDEQVCDLLNWDAEQYRQLQAQKRLL